MSILLASAVFVGAEAGPPDYMPGGNAAQPDLRPLLAFAGRISDAGTGEPVEDARIVLIGAGLEARSDEEGRFSFEGHAVSVDTLLVTHDEYRAARFVLSDLAEGGPDLRIDLRRGPGAFSSELTTEAREILAVLDARGASSWSFHQFDPFVGVVSHPLDLLLYSGLVEVVDVAPPAGGRCVLFRRGGECAAVHENEREANSVIVSGLYPWEVASFRVVPPDMGVPELDLVAGEHPGLVVVFTVEEASEEEGEADDEEGR